MEFSFSSTSKCINLPDEICPYLSDVDKLIRNKIGMENIYTIILFGSYARNDHTKNSDIDILIVVKDDFCKSKNKEYWKDLERLSLGIEKKHGLKIDKTNFVTGILNVIEKTTGMFVSHFICCQSDWDKQIFHKVFNVNAFMSTVLAPGQIVLKNMSQSYRVLYGPDQKPQIKEDIGYLQIIKSFLMTEFLALGSIFIFPLWHNVIKYSLEAFKWTIRNSYLFLSDNHASMSHIRQFFTKTAVSEEYFDRFLQLRKKFERDIMFTLRCPFELFKVYMAALRYKKVFRTKTNLNI